MDDAEKWDCEGDGDSTGAGHNADGRNKRKGQRMEKSVQGEETVGGCIGGWNKDRGGAIRGEGYGRRGECRGAVWRQKSMSILVREVTFGSQVGKDLSFYIAPLDGVKE